MSESFFGTRMLPHHHIPTQHNEGEFFGVEYLHRQAGREFVFSQDSTSTDDLVDEMDEGFVDDSMAVPSISEHLLVVGVRAPEMEKQEDEQNEEEETDSLNDVII